jgi:hypothetical protein
MRFNMKEYVDILRAYGAKDTTWRNEYEQPELQQAEPEPQQSEPEPQQIEPQLQQRAAREIRRAITRSATRRAQ